MELVPIRNGGISFMLLPESEGVYDYWVCICPLDAEFSSRVAAHRLRQASKNAAPWGTIVLDGSPILELLCASVINSVLPTEIGTILRRIQEINLREEQKQIAAKTSHVKAHYEER